MAFYVHFSITYSSDLEELDKLTELVNKYKKILEENKEKSPFEATHLLDAILEEGNYNRGAKGELFTWGFVGNYTSVQDILEYLSGFFKEQLQQELGPLDFSHIIIFEEREQSEQAECWELYLSEDKKELITIHHKLPFCWNQF